MPFGASFDKSTILISIMCSSRIATLACLARLGPKINSPVHCVFVYACELISGEPQVRKSSNVLGNLFRAARSDERGSDSRITQDPCDGHLRQALSANPRDGIERSDVAKIILGEKLPIKRRSA